MIESIVSLFLALSGVSTEEKVARMLVVGFDGKEVTGHIVRDIAEYKIGGVILFERNIESPEQLRRLTDGLHALDEDIIIGIDQEGGNVNRLKRRYGFPPTVSAQFLGSKDDTVLTRRYAREMAETLQRAGINTDFAPCVDLDLNPLNPVIGAIGRSYSADPAIVIKHARIVLDELHKHGVRGCLKHFPGHGSSTVDTHLAAADVTRTWRAEELEPYRALLGESPMVMTSHIFNASLDSEYPATMSRKILTGILRGKLGYQGVIITDDLAMRAMTDNYSLEEILVNSVNAGADLLCLSNMGGYDADIVPRAIEIITRAVGDGRIPKSRIDEAYFRISAVDH